MHISEAATIIGSLGGRPPYPVYRRGGGFFPHGDRLILEDGTGFLLLENGIDYLLLESANG
jgi:hypothetical protein